MRSKVLINGRAVGEDEPVYIVAEIGINHSGRMDKAKRMIEEAKRAGADAVKLQTYKTEKRVEKESPIFSILKECELSYDNQKELFRYARESGIEIFSTPFDEEAVDFLETLDVPCYKIASFDIVNAKLLQKIASKKRPVIISRGMAKRDEIDRALGIMDEAGAEPALLHCVSAYPVSTYDALNLKTIRALKETYGCPVGFSDHSQGIEAPKTAAALGAEAIEKHFTLSKEDGSPDNPVSIEPHEFRRMVDDIRAVGRMMGEPVWTSVPEEEGTLQFRRVT